MWSRLVYLPHFATFCSFENIPTFSNCEEFSIFTFDFNFEFILFYLYFILYFDFLLQWSLKLWKRLISFVFGGQRFPNNWFPPLFLPFLITLILNISENGDAASLNSQNRRRQFYRRWFSKSGKQNSRICHGTLPPLERKLFMFRRRDPCDILDFL